MQALGRLGIATLRQGQDEVIASVIAGRDTVAVMPTGAGKSLCFQAPALMKRGTTIVVSPLIALMKDQVDALNGRGIAATFINSTLTMGEQEHRLASVREGAYNLLYVAPERFGNASFLAGMAGIDVPLFAVDEAHCISSWGHDFRPAYRRLEAAAAGLGRPPILALTATATAEVRQDIVTELALVDARVIVTGFDRPNLTFEVVPVGGQAEKIDRLDELLRRSGTPAIVYTATRSRAEDVASGLAGRGFKAGCYHAGLPDHERHRLQDTFMAGTIDVICATNAFGMGVDKANIRLVAHHDLPRSIEAYYQEAGRAGRDGAPATCALLYSAADIHLQKYMIEASIPPLSVVAAVYEALWSLGSLELEVPIDAIAKMVPDAKGSLAVSAALRLLSDAGHLERGSRGENRAFVRLLQATLPVDGHARTLLEAMGTFGLESFKMALDQLAEASGLTEPQVRDALARLEERGIIDYVPPFTGRSTRLLEPRVAAGELRVDGEQLQRRLDLEGEKLDRVVRWATERRCRRAAVLDYFGDTHHAAACNGCDVCQGRVRPLQAAPASRFDDTAEALAALALIDSFDGRFGRFKFACALAGESSDELVTRGLTDHSSFGAMSRAGRRGVFALLGRLESDGLIEVRGTQYPLLAVTPAGLEALHLGKLPAATTAVGAGLATGTGLRGATAGDAAGWVRGTGASAITGAIARGTARGSPPYLLPTPRAARPGSRRARDEEPYDLALYSRLETIRDSIARQQCVAPSMIARRRYLTRLAREKPTTVGQAMAMGAVPRTMAPGHAQALIDAILHVAP